MPPASLLLSQAGREYVRVLRAAERRRATHPVYVASLLGHAGASHSHTRARACARTHTRTHTCWAMQIVTQALIWGIGAPVFYYSFPSHDPWCFLPPSAFTHTRARTHAHTLPFTACGLQGLGGGVSSAAGDKPGAFPCRHIG